MPAQKCKTCGHFEPVETMPGHGWCRHPKVDPANIGYRKLERANDLGCREHWPLWWTSKAERERQKKLRQKGMLSLLEE